MARYNLVFRKSVARDLKTLPKKDVTNLLRVVQSLAGEPRPLGSRKLCGDEKYRLRWGVYRILYEIHDKILVICVVKIGHRKDVYRK